MKTAKDIFDMARANANMAIDQRHAHNDSIASHAQNVVDTLRDWGVERAGGDYNQALADYYARVALLLECTADAQRRDEARYSVTAA